MILTNRPIFKMKKLLTLIASFASVLCLAQEKSGAYGTGEVPFVPGERFTMGLMYKWGAVNTEVALASVSLDKDTCEGIPAYHTAFKVKSAPFFDIFFKMREDFHSWFSYEDLRALRFTRDTFEGGYVATNVYQYDWEEGAIHADIKMGDAPRQIIDIPLKGNVQDLPTLIYTLRTMDMDQMTVGTATPLRFAIDDAVFDVKITYRGRQNLKVRKMGRVMSHHFSCQVVSGAMFEGDTELQVWFSADENRLPVAVMARRRVGAVWAWLKTYDGLKYPFSARQ